MRKEKDEETGKTKITMSRAEMAIKLEKYLVDEHGSQAAAARHIGMSPQQLSDMLNCNVMITDRVYSLYKNATRNVKSIDTYTFIE